jgi:hypothetical protein
MQRVDNNGRSTRRERRHRGLTKNSARAFAAFELASLLLVRKRLTPCGTECARVRRQWDETPPRGAAPKQGAAVVASSKFRSLPSGRSHAILRT